MRLRRLLGALLGLLLAGMVAEARADIIFSLDQGTINPDENVLFNCVTGCVSGPALTVTGATNNTGVLIDFLGTENLITPAIGQARIEDEAQDGFNSILIDADDSTLFFSEFETNIRIFAQTSGTATVTACNQFAVCEVEAFALSSGENFFVLSVIDPQLINTVHIGTTVGIMDLRQTRVSLATSDGEEVTVPEPTSLSLLGLGLMFGANRYRRKRSAA